MKKIIAFLLAVLLISFATIPAFAVPNISSVKFITLEEFKNAELHPIEYFINFILQVLRYFVFFYGD